MDDVLVWGYITISKFPRIFSIELPNGKVFALGQYYKINLI